MPVELLTWWKCISASRSQFLCRGWHSINPETGPTANRVIVIKESHSTKFRYILNRYRDGGGTPTYLLGEHRTRVGPAGCWHRPNGAVPNIPAISLASWKISGAATADYFSVERTPRRFPFPETRKLSRDATISLDRGACNAFAEDLYIAAPSQIRARVYNVATGPGARVRK